MPVYTLKEKWHNLIAEAPEDPRVDKEKVMRWVQNLRCDPWYEVEWVPYASEMFSEWVGMERKKTEAAVQGRGRAHSYVALPHLARLAEAMEAIDSGRVAFFRRMRSPRGSNPYVSAHTLPIGSAMLRFVPPPDAEKSVQPSLHPREWHSHWARCGSCGGRRFAAVKIDGGQDYATCWDCVPPRTYRSLGASMMRPRLVVDLANKEYPPAAGEVWR